jgi:hypothetical protein
MSPKMKAVADALRQMDATPPHSFAYRDRQRALLVAVQAAGFDPRRAAEDWARYKVAVAEVDTDAAGARP